MTFSRSLDQCIFCGSEEMTEEHLVADWVLRAFHRSKKLPSHFSGTMVGTNELRMSADEPVSTAKVVCRPCNNEWLSGLDNAAAQALKPLVQGRAEVQLDRETQAAAAAWIFKCALIFDASQAGNAGSLAGLRAQFARDRLAPPGCTIYAGPAPPTPFEIEGIPEVAGLTLFGVRSTSGTVTVTVNLRQPDGSVVAQPPQAFPTPGYTVMLDGLHAIISGRRGPIIPTPEWKFECVWPVSSQPVTLSSVPPDLASAA